MLNWKVDGKQGSVLEERGGGMEGDIGEGAEKVEGNEGITIVILT